MLTRHWFGVASIDRLSHDNGDGPPQADASDVRWTGSSWEPLATGLPVPTSLAVTAGGSVHVLTLDGTIWRIAPAS